MSERPRTTRRDGEVAGPPSSEQPPDQPESSHGHLSDLVTTLGPFGTASAGRALSKVVVSATCLVWRLPVRAKASMRIVGAIVVLIAGIGLVAVVVSRIRADLGLAATGLSFLAAVVVYGLAWLGLSMARGDQGGPRRRRPRSSVNLWPSTRCAPYGQGQTATTWH